MLYRMFAVLCGTVFGSGAVLATERTIESRPEAATVFPDRALITRRAALELGVGETTVVLPGLPAALIENSIRVEGEGPEGLVIGSMEIRRVHAEELIRDEERRLDSELMRLRDDRSAVENRLRAQHDQLKFIQSLAAAAPARINEEIGWARLDPKAWKEAWVAIGEGSGQTLERIQAMEIERRRIDEKIAKLERDLQQIRTGARESIEARVALKAARAGSAALRLSYQIHGASWSPIYDARLEVEAARTRLSQKAQVRQRTGEDWSGIALTLSTARPSEGVAAPELPPWFIGIQDPLAQDAVLRAERAKMGSAAMAPAAPAAGYLEDALPTSELDRPQKAKAETAVVVSADFVAEYRIAGLSNVPADGEAHQFTLQEHALAADLWARSVPRLQPAAFLIGESVYRGPTPLPAGTVAIYRGNAYIGQGTLPMIRPEEKVILSYGIDDRIKIQHAPEVREQSREGLFNKKRREERHWRITAANHHDRRMRIQIIDQWPVPQDERIEVERLRDGTPPTAEDWDHQKGRVMWEEELAPGRELEIRFGYAVAWPEGAILSGF